MKIGPFLVFAVLVFAGCGDDSPKSSTGGTSSTAKANSTSSAAAKPDAGPGQEGAGAGPKEGGW